MNKGDLPVQYYGQSNAWMTGASVDVVLSKLNHKLSRKGGFVVLFMDNAGCHPEKSIATSSSSCKHNIKAAATGFRHNPKLQGPIPQIIPSLCSFKD